MGRIEMHLVSKMDQVITISGPGINVNMLKGETIHTENSYKFSPDQIHRLATGSDFQIDSTWTDENQMFRLDLLTPA